MSDTLIKTKQVKSKLTKDEVIDFLTGNPDFLNRNPELYDILTPPKEKTQRGVVDFQHYMVRRLKEDRDDIIQSAREMIETTRSNTHNLSRVHTVVLALLEAGNFEDFIHTITMDTAGILGVDIVTLVIENDSGSIPHINLTGIRIAAPGVVAAKMGKNHVLLETGVSGSEALYGAGAAMVKSQALLRLNIGKGIPSSLIAFGSRDPDMFLPDHATDLVTFLGGVIERCFRAWLDAPQ